MPGFLLTDTWGQERRLARVLYTEARILAREVGLREVRANAASWGDYPHEVGYRRRGPVWRVDLAEPLVLRDELPATACGGTAGSATSVLSSA